MVHTIINFIIMYLDMMMITWGANCTLIGVSIILYGTRGANKEYIKNQYYREVARSVGRGPSEAGSCENPKKDTVKKDLQIGFIVVGVTLVLLGAFRLTRNKIVTSLMEQDKQIEKEQSEYNVISIGHNYNSVEELWEDLNNGQRNKK